MIRAVVVGTQQHKFASVGSNDRPQNLSTDPCQSKARRGVPLGIH
jgi:hypothetical protein